VISLEPMIKDLIRRLGDPGFDVRQAASESLARILPFAVGALREAEKNSKDPEVVLRAERLLKTFEANCVDYQFRQALQGVPPKFKSRLLEMITRDPSALPDSRTIAEILIEQGTPRPPPQPPPMPGPVMPGPAMPPPPNRGPFVWRRDRAAGLLTARGSHELRRAPTDAARGSEAVPRRTSPADGRARQHAAQLGERPGLPRPCRLPPPCRSAGGGGGAAGRGGG
jgi:hypothetical protein